MYFQAVTLEFTSGVVAHSASRRPFGVKVLVGLLLLGSAVELTSAGGLVTVILGSVSLIRLPAVATLLGLPVPPLVFAVVYVVAAIGLLQLERWAWVFVMLIVGARMIFDLWQYLAVGDRPYLAMLLNVVVVFYLNQSEVQRAFGQAKARSRSLERPVQVVQE